MTRKQWIALAVAVPLHLLAGAAYLFSALTVPPPRVYALWATWVVVTIVMLLNVRRPLIVYLTPAIDVGAFLVVLLVLTIIGETFSP